MVTVILDTKVPEVKGTPEIASESPYYTTDKDSLDFNVSAQDENGIYNKGFFVTSSGNIPLDFDETGKAAGKVPLKDGLNSISLLVMDNAANKYIKKMTVVKGNPSTSFGFTFDNLSDNYYLNKEDISDGVFIIKGHVNNKNIKEFKINDEDVKINDDLTFSHDIKLNW